MAIGKPLELLTQSVGFVVCVDLKTHTKLRGTLITVDDCMNLYLKDVTVTTVDHAERPADEFFVRGSQICYLCLPDMLQYSPIFPQPALD